MTLTNSQHGVAGPFIGADERGLHQDCEVWLERVVPHSPIEHGWRNRTSEVRPHPVLRCLKEAVVKRVSEPR